MATIYEIADKAGVSPKTAARILAGESLKSKHRTQVLACADELGYVRNQQAANLRTGRSRLVGVLVPYIDNPFYTSFLQEVHNALSSKRYHALIACSFGEAETMLDAMRLFEAYNIDGLVLNVSEGELTPPVLTRLREMQRREKPVIIAGGPKQNTPHDHFFLDDPRAMGLAVNHLAERGHRKIAFLGATETNPTIQNRLSGYRLALKRLQIDPNPTWVSLGDASLHHVSDRVRAILRGKDKPTAFVCTSDMIAMAAIRTAVGEGLRVPKDVAVVGFDDIDQAAYMNPSLTTMRQPIHEMAEAIVELALHRLESNALPVQQRRYDAQIVVRDST
ncbi:MAG: LacI family DNA-binding transcriptional regulator [Opitutaceae bacterium]|nr:LacI family DNA-binding transcriptional regulator [Opitutaceae bacterium]